MPTQAHANHPSAPPELVTVLEKTVRGMDQKLGYPGKERYVFFYYEPRGEEVVWRDRKGYGFATGAWETFLDELAPLADLYNVDVGSNGEPGKDVLLIDRIKHRAYFVERKKALRLLKETEHGQGDLLAEQMASVEITHESITQLAHEIWERRGRPEGETLQHWLEAEAQLRATQRAAGKLK